MALKIPVASPTLKGKPPTPGQWQGLHNRALRLWPGGLYSAEMQALITSATGKASLADCNRADLVDAIRAFDRAHNPLRHQQTLNITHY